MGNVEEDRAPLETNKNALMQETNKQQIERFAPCQNHFYGLICVESETEQSLKSCKM